MKLLHIGCLEGLSMSTKFLTAGELAALVALARKPAKDRRVAIVLSRYPNGAGLFANAVGLDTPSLDYGQSNDLIAHRILLAKNIPGLENVATLEQLPATGSLVVALPVKIGQGSGAPLRIVAMIPGR